MYKIIKEIETKIIIEKSKFICLVFNCSSQEKQNEILKQVKHKHLSATHICFASLFFKDEQIYSYSSDDKEPSGTAGLQILQALKEQNVINALCVVVRYFGGIKLGIAGLGRAYKESAISAIINNKKEATLKTKCFILCDYNTYNKVKPYFVQNNIKQENLEFKNEISFYSYLNSNEQDYLKKICKIDILNEKDYY